MKPATNKLTSPASKAQLRPVDVEVVEFAFQVHTRRSGRPAFEIKEEQPDNFIRLRGVYKVNQLVNKVIES